MNYNNILNTNTPVFREKFNNDKKNETRTNAVSSVPFPKVLLNRNLMKQIDNTFSNSVDFSTKVTNQHSSGRCWLFSFTNLLRHGMIKRYNLRENFELSQNFLSFYDKLEKSQYFLENIYKLKSVPDGDMRLRYLLKAPITDGGFWNMACNLVKKYGIVPLSNMNETYGSTHTGGKLGLNFILNRHLRKYAYVIRKRKFNRKEYEKWMTKRLYNIYKILVYFLGQPPAHFDWKYYLKGQLNNENIKKTIKGLTPVKFFKKYVNFNPDDYHILVNLPMEKYPFYKLYSLTYCNNMIDGRTPEFINVPMKEMVNSVRHSIDDGEPVWFGSDVHHFLNRKLGIAHIDLYDYKWFDEDDEPDLNKEDRIIYRESSPNHAMLILGYDMYDETLKRFLIENSWGTVKGSKEGKKEGFIHMSKKWFEEYAFEVVINKDNLSRKVKNSIDSDQVKDIKPWSLFPCEAL